MGGGPITDGNGGGVPTFQEAKEATTELSIAIGKAYLSSPDSDESSLVADHGSSLSNSGSQVTENMDLGAATEIAVAHAVPANIIMAFRLLHENSAAQDAVASIASDPKVWNAVSCNQKLREFLQSQKAACLASSDTNQSSAESIVFASESQDDNGFMDIVEKVKINVVHMMNRFSDYFRRFFGVEETNRDRVFASSDGSESSDADMEASFVGLAVMAIAVILTKRA